MFEAKSAGGIEKDKSVIIDRERALVWKARHPIGREPLKNNPNFRLQALVDTFLAVYGGV